MKQLTCEMCGSTNLMKQDGVFVCQTCGCQYSVEEAKKMMVEGTVEVFGTVKIDNSEKYNNILQLAEEAFFDNLWDSAYDYCNEILTMNPNNPLIITMQGLAFLGKSKIEQSVLTVSRNAMKRALDTFDTDGILDAESLTTLSKISSYLVHACEAKKSELDEEIRYLNSERSRCHNIVEAERLSATIASMGRDAYMQGSVLSSRRKITDAMQTAAEIDRQISAVKRSKSSLDRFFRWERSSISAIQDDNENRKKEKRKQEYWAEHVSEKAALDAEQEAANNRLTSLQEQFETISKEVDLQIGSLIKKKSEKIPEEIEVNKQKELVRELEEKIRNLSFFKWKERKSITEHLHTVEYPKLDELNRKCTEARKEYMVKINEEIAACRARRDELQNEVDSLEKRIEEIEEELTKDR